MNRKTIGKILLLYTIAINIIKTQSEEPTSSGDPANSENTITSEDGTTSDTANTLIELFKFDYTQVRQKEIHFDEAFSKAVLDNKPTGLQKTVLDLVFPEIEFASETKSRYRIVQCLAVGEIDYIQKKTYKNVVLKLTTKDKHEDKEDTDAECHDTFILTLSPPGTINATDNALTNVYKLYQKEVKLKRGETNTVVFEDVLDGGFLRMDLFWVNFEIKGKCSKYLEVDLLKPLNSSLYGDMDPSEKGTQETRTSDSQEVVASASG